MESERPLNGHVASPQNRYGERFLHLVFDDISTSNPDRLYASIPLSTDLTEGFKDLSFRDVAYCVDIFAHSLERDIGRSTKAETVAYLGLPDVRNVVVFLAAVKCGYKV